MIVDIADGVHETRWGKSVVVVVLAPYEARNLAYALGLHDVGAQDLFRWADEAEARNGSKEDDE